MCEQAIRLYSLSSSAVYINVSLSYYWTRLVNIATPEMENQSRRRSTENNVSDQFNNAQLERVGRQMFDCIQRNAYVRDITYSLIHISLLTNLIFIGITTLCPLVSIAIVMFLIVIVFDCQGNARSRFAPVLHEVNSCFVFQ
jgi:hypothetical protein